MSRTIALTGATGFIGSTLACRLERAGWQLRVLVRSRSPRARLAGIAVQWIEGDLGDIESLRRLVRGAYAVVHCAGAVRGASHGDFNLVNVAGVARVVHAATGMDPLPRFLLISSLAAREPHLSPYAASKRQGEEVLAALAGQISWAALRPAAVYGPGDRELLPLFRWMGWGIAPVVGPESARFSLLYVDDLAEAVLRWLACRNREPCTFELHDGRPEGYTWDDVVATVACLRGKRVVRLHVPLLILRLLAELNLMGAQVVGYAPMLTPGKVCELRHTDWVCDNTRFWRETGWTPTVSLEQGLRRTLGWNGG
jgi:nucleoside-diphosphate-sugar epimerase